ncbi:MAG: NAD(P)-dependent oxidoreductase [Solirubrobacterales bacterium]
MSDQLRSVAVLGTGTMGAPMARNIAAAGLGVRAWNRTRERAEALRGDGIEVADTPAEAAAGVDAVLTVLADGRAVHAVMADEGALEAMSRESIWIQASTVGLASTEELMNLAEGAGVPFVDSPVLGTKAPAEAGELTVLASGPGEALASVRPVFEAVGARTIELGAAGNGSRMKLIVNDWLLTLTMALAETLALADALGIDGAKFLEVIEGGPIDAGYAQLKGKMMLAGNYEPSFALALARKDADLVREAAAAQRIDLPLNEVVRDRLAAAEKAGHGDADMASVREAIG